MTRPVSSYVFETATPYVADRGVIVAGAGFRTVDPGVDITAVITAAGARLKTPADSTPCPEGTRFRPRKLTAVFLDGQSFSVAVNTNANLIAVATAMLGIANVACVQLAGEYWADLIEEFKPAGGAAPVAGTPNTFAAGKKLKYAGTINYTNDVGVIVPTKVKVDTDVVAAATGVTSEPTILGGAFTTCAGAFQPRNPCPGKKGRDHRRYIGTFLMTGIGGGENFYGSIEIPEALGTAASLVACGTALGGNASIACLAYRGEFDRSFHRSIPQAA